MCPDYLDTINFGQGVQHTFVTRGICHYSPNQVVGLAGGPPPTPVIGTLLEHSFKCLDPHVVCVAQPDVDKRGHPSIQVDRIDERDASLNDPGLFEGSNAPQTLGFGESPLWTELGACHSGIARQLENDPPIDVVKVTCSKGASH